MKPSTLACLFASLLGCDRVFQLDTVTTDDGGMSEPSSIDAPPVCYGTDLFQPCFNAPLPEASLAVVGNLDTGSDPDCTVVMSQSTGTEICVLAARIVTVPGAFIAYGKRPLAIVSGSSITITGTLDASSTEVRTGAGAQASCGIDGDGGDSANGGAGGSGGTFGFVGGVGQAGGGDNTTAHGARMPTALPDVRGGCPGYTGGVSGAGGSRAPGGAGGGAVWLIAADAIVVDAAAILNASGAGGPAGGLVSGGGGGGGAGGLIGFDAPMITIDGMVFARGAGGGGGANTIEPGGRGFDPQTTGSQTPGGTPAIGGAAGPGWPGCGALVGTNGGTNGGHGAGTVPAGGGGGGGGCGIIRVLGSRDIAGGMINPTPTP